MSRKIKFRAWNKVADRYSKPFGLHQDVLNYTDVGGLGVIKSLTDETVEQFTGLTDKNGKDIYEGDVLEHKPYDILKKVVYKEGSFMLNTNLGDAVMWAENTNHLEIIGNIHESPELLK